MTGTSLAWAMSQTWSRALTRRWRRAPEVGTARYGSLMAPFQLPGWVHVGRRTPPRCPGSPEGTWSGRKVHVWMTSHSQPIGAGHCASLRGLPAMTRRPQESTCSAAAKRNRRRPDDTGRPRGLCAFQSSMLPLPVRLGLARSLRAVTGPPRRVMDLAALMKGHAQALIDWGNGGIESAGVVGHVVLLSASGAR